MEHNGLFLKARNYVKEYFDLRAELDDEKTAVEAVMDGVLIDTDSVNFASRNDAMRYYRNQPKIGVPDIYQFSNSEMIQFSDADRDEIRGIFKKYAAEMDEKYGKA